MINKMIARMLGIMGYEVKIANGPCTQKYVLRQAHDMGFMPATVIDVGAAHGEFSLNCAKVFPDAEYLLIDPLEEYRPFIETARKNIGRSHHCTAAAASHEGDITLNVHPDLVGSSLFLEKEDTNVNGVPRTVKAVTLDRIVRERGLKPPYLVKVDVQGSELEVLEGAKEIVADFGLVILETSFYEFFKGGPQMHDVVAYMKSNGFMVYDIFGLSHRPLDGALAQANFVFVKEDGPLRANHHYATPDQRAQLTERLKR